MDSMAADVVTLFFNRRAAAARTAALDATAAALGGGPSFRCLARAPPPTPAADIGWCMF
jgi:hypothetical protein